MLGMRMACIATSCSSSVGMNSWPSRVNRKMRSRKKASEDQITKPVSRRAPRSTGSYSRLAPRMSEIFLLVAHCP